MLIPGWSSSHRSHPKPEISCVLSVLLRAKPRNCIFSFLSWGFESLACVRNSEVWTLALFLLTSPLPLFVRITSSPLAVILFPLLPVVPLAISWWVINYSTAEGRKWRAGGILKVWIQFAIIDEYEKMTNGRLQRKGRGRSMRISFACCHTVLSDTRRIPLGIED